MSQDFDRYSGRSANSSQDYPQSNLQASAPEYYPLNSSQGAVRKKHGRYTVERQAAQRQEQVSQYSNLQPDAQEFYPSTSNGGVKKKSYNKSWKDRNKFSEWRSGYSEADNPRQKSNYERESAYDATNKQQWGATDDQYGTGEYSSRKQSYNRNNYYGKNSNKNYYQKRNGYVSKSYSNTNNYRHQKQNIDNENDDGDYSLLDRPVYPDFRQSSDERTKKYRLYPAKTPRDHGTANQRERLTDMIDNNMLECLVCCEKIKRNDKVWSCLQCYHIVHLNCITAWAKSSKTEENWRCPACQQFYPDIPSQYSCYCGKIINPKLNPNIIAHGCDNLCLKKGKNCDHKCNILCHPGPCPECTIMVSKQCGCGSTQQTVKCCSDIKIVCDNTCNKVLNCGLHTCQSQCHVGECSACSDFIIQDCFCGKTGRKVQCDKENAGKTQFVCENPCDKLLSCGNHRCNNICHSGPCSSCDYDVRLIKHCYCGKTPLETPRTSCLDPIPCCDKLCDKVLICGPPSKPHTCKEKCHKGKCPACPLTTVIRCRCGHMDKEVACLSLTTKANDVRCEKKCTKKRLCGKHTCKQKCCIEIDHACPLPCNKVLSCGLHRCELTCHSGRCPPCMESSFEELFCECGATVLYPPIACGTKPPACKKPCNKLRSCGHPSNHECHPGPCPACFVLTKQWCYGLHEQRPAIPCNQKSFSCGLPCGKSMPCGRHKCVKPCHDDECPVPCTQPCNVPRSLCGHPCGKPCHDPPCPESNCKQIVPVTCTCGLQKSTKPCMELSEEYRNLKMAQLQDKMNNLAMNQSVDLSDLNAPKKPITMKILECNEECKVLERNRRLAIGLQIQNPDLSQKLTPRYSDFLKQWAKKDPKFCQRVHSKLTELVQLAKQSKQKSRSYSFESMNRDKRHFIHEYCEYFGMESAAYDAEPNRNVVATAIKDKSWLPSMSLLEVLQRENGQRKVPGPMLGGYSSGRDGESVSLKLLTSAKTK